MAGEIDEHVDTVVAYALDEPAVVERVDTPVGIGRRAKARVGRVLDAAVVVDEMPHSVAIERFELGREERADDAGRKARRNPADAERRAARAVRRGTRREGLGVAARPVAVRHRDRGGAGTRGVLEGDEARARRDGIARMGFGEQRVVDERRIDVGALEHKLGAQQACAAMARHCGEHFARDRDRIVAAALRFERAGARVAHRGLDPRRGFGVARRFRVQLVQEHERRAGLAPVLERLGRFEREAFLGAEPRQRLA